MNSLVPPQNSLFRFGAAYYPDYIQPARLGRTAAGEIIPMSFEERLASDFARMQKAGIQEIRMGEFAWASLEPEPGSFQPQCFLAALNQAQSHGISVIFCTPTATPPKWLVDAMPEMLPRDAYGHIHAFGSRRHYDPCHPGFRQHSQRITRLVAQTFGSHHAIVAWQIDNELGHHGTHECRSEAAQAAFRNWLRRIYDNDIERLNREWFTAFWSQRYRSFEEIEIPSYTFAGIGPHIEMDYRLFCNEVYREFQAEQIALLKRYSPGRPITTNLISNFYGLCPWQLNLDLDFVGFDHYQDDPNPNPIRSASNFTLMRSLKNQKFKVLEQQPVQVNWQKINRRFRFDWLWLWAFQAAAYGADTMHYFSWQRFSGGPEQYHDAILPHDLRNPWSQQEKTLLASHQMFSLLQQELAWQKFPETRDEVLIVHNTQSLWSHRICAQSEDYDATFEIDRMTRICTSLGLGFRFVDKIPTQNPIGSLKCLILPGYALELTKAERTWILDFISSGGWVLSFPRTAMKTLNQHMSPLPCSITDSESYYFVEYGALGPEELESVHVKDFHFFAERWAEHITLSQSSTYQVVAQFSNGLYQGSPAIIQRKIGHGSHLHFAFCPQVDQNFLSYLSQLGCFSARLITPFDAEVQAIPLLTKNQDFLALINFSEKSQLITLKQNYQARLSLHLNSELQLEVKVSSIPQSELAPRSIVLFEIAGESEKKWTQRAL